MKKSMLNSFDPERRQCSHLVSFHAGYVEKEKKREKRPPMLDVVFVKRKGKEKGNGIIVSHFAHHHHNTT